MFVSERLPLDKHVLFLSTSLDEVRDRTAQVLCPHGFRIHGNRHAFAARHHYVGLHALSLNYIQYGSAATIEPGFLNDFYVLLMPIEGFVELDIEGRQYVLSPESCAVLSPSSYVRMNWSTNCRTLLIRINRTTVETILAAEIGRVAYKPLVFEPVIHLKDTFGASLFRSISYVLGEIEATAPMLHFGSVIDHVEASIVGMLLRGQRHNYVPDLENTNEAIPGYVKRVERYIELNAGRDIQLDDLLTVAGVSASTLRVAFRRSKGLTPMEYVRMAKLERTRLDLLSASPGATVTAIASRWGFEQFGRFAGLYRQHYNETPSQTLRRATNRFEQ